MKDECKSLEQVIRNTEAHVTALERKLHVNRKRIGYKISDRGYKNDNAKIISHWKNKYIQLLEQFSELLASK